MYGHRREQLIVDVAQADACEQRVLIDLVEARSDPLPPLTGVLLRWELVLGGVGAGALADEAAQVRNGVNQALFA